MLEIVLTREDANTEFALLAEWLVEDRAKVTPGQPVCVVETTKATVEIESPGAGTLVQLYAEDVEVELGKTIAYVTETAEELASVDVAEKEKPAPKPALDDRQATRKATELAELHGVDLGEIDKRGFITEKDVEELIARRRRLSRLSRDPFSRESRRTACRCRPHSTSTRASARSSPLSSSRCEPIPTRSALSHRTRRSGRCASTAPASARASRLGEGTLVAAPRVVIEDGVRIGPRGTVVCEEVVAIGELTQFGHDLELRCRRAFLGAGIWARRSIRFGGGGHRDPWATLAVGDLAFVGDEAFVNVCRPVLIGREVFLTMRSMIVTHNIGHSVFEGFENRFAPVVLEDRSQVGLGAVLYAGCRIGAEAIVASGSYVVGDIPAGSFAIGVPAKVTGSSSHKLPMPGGSSSRGG